MKNTMKGVPVTGASITILILFGSLLGSTKSCGYFGHSCINETHFEMCIELPNGTMQSFGVIDRCPPGLRCTEEHEYICLQVNTDTSVGEGEQEQTSVTTAKPEICTQGLSDSGNAGEAFGIPEPHLIHIKPFEQRNALDVNNFTCPSAGLFPAPPSCSTYHVCVHLGPIRRHYIRSCWRGFEFSPRWRVCLPRAFSGCSREAVRATISDSSDKISNNNSQEDEDRNDSNDSDSSEK